MQENVVLAATEINLVNRDILKSILTAQMHRAWGRDWLNKVKDYIYEEEKSDDEDRRKMAWAKYQRPSQYKSADDFDTTRLTYMMLNDPTLSQYFQYDPEVLSKIRTLRNLRNNLDHKKDSGKLQTSDVEDAINEIEECIAVFHSNLDDDLFDQYKTDLFTEQLSSIGEKYLGGFKPAHPKEEINRKEPPVFIPPYKPFNEPPHFKQPEMNTRPIQPRVTYPVTPSKPTHGGLSLWMVFFSLLLLLVILITGMNHRTVYENYHSHNPVSSGQSSEQQTIETEPYVTSSLPVGTGVTDSFQIYITGIEPMGNKTRVHFHAVNYYMAGVNITSTNLQAAGQVSSIEWGRSMDSFQLSNNTVPMNSEFDFYLDYSGISVEPGQEVVFNCSFMHNGLDSAQISGRSATISFVY